METLSIEIIREIFSYIESKHDIKNLRLVQSSFAQLGEEFLFRNILLMPSLDDLNRLHEISCKPKLARYVKEVTLDVSYHAFGELIWPDFKQELGRGDIRNYMEVDKLGDDDDYDEILSIFQTFVDQSYEFLVSSEHTDKLTAAFTRFPRLQGLTLSDKVPGRTPWKPVTPLVSESLAEVGLYSLVFEAYVNAAYLSGAKITSFKAGGVYQREAGIYASAFHDPELDQRTAAIFRNCKTIDLRIDNDGGRKPQETPLRDYFHAAANLENLGVYFADSHGKNPFSGIIGSHTWPYLKRLEFGGVRISDDELYEFLGRHKSTLRELTIYSTMLWSGDWVEIGKVMRMDLRLVFLSLRFLWGPNKVYVYKEEYCTAIVNHVLNG